MGIFTEFFRVIKETETPENKDQIVPYYGNEDIVDENTVTWTSMGDVIEYHADQNDPMAAANFGTGPIEPTNDIKLTIEEIIAIMRDEEAIFYFRENAHRLEIGSQDPNPILRIKLSV